MKIIRASISHAETIAALNFFVQKIHHKAHPKIFKSYCEDEGIKPFFEQILKNQKNYLFLAYIEDIPVGYLWAQIQKIPETPLTYSTKRIYIHHVSVDDKYRRTGVGACLMEQVKMVSKEQVQTVLDKVRPSLQADGGDCELVQVREDGVVEVRLQGACGSCPMATLTLKAGIERVLKEELPEIKEVISV